MISAAPEQQQSPEVEAQVAVRVCHELRGLKVFPIWGSESGEYAQRVLHVLNRDGDLIEICYVYSPSVRVALGVKYLSDRMRIHFAYKAESNFILDTSMKSMLGHSKMDFDELAEIIRELAPDPKSPRIVSDVSHHNPPHNSALKQTIELFRDYFKAVFRMNR
jgi:hypothetical protein